MNSVLITGSEGGIGRELCAVFSEAGYQVIGIDRVSAPHSEAYKYLQVDLEEFVSDRGRRDQVCADIRHSLDSERLDALINNAAVQHIGEFASISDGQWQSTISVNLMAPMMLTREFLPELSMSHGSVVNISSIHAKLTKPGFTSYATSKAALLGLTSALAVELGQHIRVMAICPAAVATPMLKNGFVGQDENLRRLCAYHPSNSIGESSALARLILYMVEARDPFYNGMVVNFDGGIGSLLHDPALNHT